MIFLDKIGSFTIVKSICYPADVHRLDRDNLYVIPTSREEDFHTIINRFATRSNLKIRLPKAMLVPWKELLYYKTAKKRYQNKDYQKDIKMWKDKGFPKAASVPSVLNNYNGFVDNTKIIANTLNLGYTTKNSIFFWKNLIKNYDTIHKHKFLVFCPDNMLVRATTTSAITIKNGLNSRNLYLNFLINLKINYPIMRTLLREAQMKILITDYKWSFMIDYNDLPEDSSVFWERFFACARKLATGLDISEEELILEDENSSSDAPDVEKESILKAAEKMSSQNDVNNLAGGEAIKTIGEIPDNEDPDIKNDKYEEQAIIIARILKESSHTPDVNDNINVSERLKKVTKRLQEIKKKNTSDIVANLEEKADNIMVSKKVHNSSGTMNEFKIADMDLEYAKIAKKNRVDIGEKFSKATTPLFLANYKEKDDVNSADTKAKLVQYQFQSATNTKEKHTFTVRVPELREGKFLHINGSDKVMVRQKMALPITKVKDKVLFTSYFGKMFIQATRGNLSKISAKFKRWIKYIRKNYPFSTLKQYFDFTPAYFEKIKTNDFGTELLEASRYMSKLTVGDNYIDLASTERDGKNVKIAMIFGEPYYATVNDEIEDSKGEVISFLKLITMCIAASDEPALREWDKIVNKKETTTMAYSEVVVMAKATPLIMVLLHYYDENLLPILEILKRDYNLEYKITPIDKKKPAKIYDDDEGNQLVFKNFVLDIKYNNVDNRVLLTYLLELDLSEYSSLKLKGIIEEMYDSKHIMNMENYRDFFIDPVATASVMEDMGIPSDYGEALIYANSLLFNADREISEVSIKNERMPSNEEIIQGVLYRNAANSFIDYSNKTKRGSSTASFSVEKDAVLKDLLMLPNVEESSKLNPVQHVDKLLTISGKGVSGVNEDRAYTHSKREWDKSFYGIMSDVSPFTKASGVSMRLAVNPNITDMKGYFDSKKPEDVSKDEIMSVSETLGAFAQRHDSSPRLAMGMQQFNHLVGTEGSNPALVTYGMDESLAKLDSDFAYQMADDGQVIEMNERYIKVKYNHLKDDNNKPLEQVFNINKVERNAAKAKYILNKMVVNKELKIKKGAKLFKGDILAYNPDYYQRVGEDITFKSGPIVYVALANIQNSFEDALFITVDLAKKLKAKTLKRIAVKLGPYSKIVEHADLGPIKPNDIVMKYAEDTGSAFFNRNIDASLLDDYLLKTKKCNYNGILRDVFVYYKLTDKELQDLDPSIKKFMKNIDDYYNTKYNNKELATNIPGYEKNRVLDHTTRFKDAKRNKVNGDSVDKGEILIEFYVETDMEFTIGDKVTIENTALKGVASKIVDEEFIPYGAKTKRKLHAIFSQYSPLARMVYSLFLKGLLTEIMIQANKHIKEEILGIPSTNYD